MLALLFSITLLLEKRMLVVQSEEEELEKILDDAWKVLEDR